jgi:hypothetical protein
MPDARRSGAIDSTLPSRYLVLRELQARLRAHIVWRALALMVLALCAGNLAWAQQTDWIRPFSTPHDSIVSQANAMTRDESGIYVVESYKNTPSAAPLNPLLRKVDFDGRVIWTRRFEFVAGEGAFTADVAVDGTGIYVIGNNFRLTAATQTLSSSTSAASGSRASSAATETSQTRTS